MNDTTPEQLSALMDGELPRDEMRFLLRRLDNDADLAQRWSRYQVVSSVLKRQYVATAGDAAFATAVLARLDQDSAKHGYLSRALRWAGGGAIAAAVAVVALVATKPTGDAIQSGAPGSAIAVVAPTVTQPMAALTRGGFRQPALPEQVMPAGFVDYAKPASYESIVPMYGTQGRNSNGSNLDSAGGFVPYVLLIGARQQSPDAAAPASGSGDPSRQ